MVAHDAELKAAIYTCSFRIRSHYRRSSSWPCGLAVFQVSKAEHSSLDSRHPNSKQCRRATKQSLPTVGKRSSRRGALNRRSGQEKRPLHLSSQGKQAPRRSTSKICRCGCGPIKEDNPLNSRVCGRHCFPGDSRRGWHGDVEPGGACENCM